MIESPKLIVSFIMIRLTCTLRLLAPGNMGNMMGADSRVIAKCVRVGLAWHKRIGIRKTHSLQSSTVTPSSTSGGGCVYKISYIYIYIYISWISEMSCNNFSRASPCSRRRSYIHYVEDNSNALQPKRIYLWSVSFTTKEIDVLYFSKHWTMPKSS
jgi:hypothetical protein